MTLLPPWEAGALPSPFLCLILSLVTVDSLIELIAPNRENLDLLIVTIHSQVSPLGLSSIIQVSDQNNKSYVLIYFGL